MMKPHHRHHPSRPSLGLAAEAAMLAAETLPLSVREQMEWHERGWAEAQRMFQVWGSIPPQAHEVADKVMIDSPLTESSPDFWACYKEAEQGAQDYLDSMRPRSPKGHHARSRQIEGWEDLPAPAPRIECLAVSPSFRPKAPNVEVMGRLGVERMPTFRQGVRDRLGPEPGIEDLHPVAQLGDDATMQFRHRGGGYLGSEAVPGYYLNLGGMLKLLKGAEEPSDAGHRAAMKALDKLLAKMGGGREHLPTRGGGAEYLRPGSTRMSSAEPGKFIVQTILFEDAHFNRASAEAWAKSHGFGAEKVAHEGNHWRVRQMDPGLFEEDSFRTKPITQGVKLVLGRLR